MGNHITAAISAGHTLIARTKAAGAALSEALLAAVGSDSRVTELRARGLMQGLELNVPAKPVVAELMRRGLITIPTGEHVVRFLPPLTVKDEEIERAAEIVGAGLGDLE